MKRKQIIIVIITIFFISHIYGKRSAPKEVDPIIYKNIIIKVNHFKMGFVEIWDKENSKLLYDIKIYKVKYDSFIEKDVQDVYIKKIYLVDNYLIIINEQNKYYKLNLETNKVSKLEDEDAEKLKL